MGPDGGNRTVYIGLTAAGIPFAERMEHLQSFA
jgi:hypothetical protein